MRVWCSNPRRWGLVDFNPKWNLRFASQAALERALTVNATPRKALHPVDICQPARFYPDARKLKRKLILHVGPTNSGKSYTALKAFSSAKSGFYAGPLRMLAREVYDRMEGKGVLCNLLTGDEKIEKFDKQGKLAKLSCGTIEMTDCSQKMDVAVIDEIQMINDPERGWAWTRAFLGVQAKEVHLCGDRNAEHIVRQLIHQTGDSLEVKYYKRLSGLEMDPTDLTPTNMVKNLKPGDCVICFSKQKVKATRDQIIRLLGKPCAVIYGSLPPEIRAEQASLFNDPNSGVDLLVASDAIGMGLNLAIKRVIFTTLNKFDGEKLQLLSIPQIKQIAGRAGRYRVANDPKAASSATTPDEKPANEVGLVAALKKSDRKLIKEALHQKSPPIISATCWPPNNIIKASSIDKAQKFSYALEEVFDIAKIGPAYSRPRAGNVINVARLYDDVWGLTFDDKLMLANAPVSDTPECLYAFKRFCEVIGSGQAKNITQILSSLQQLDNPAAPAGTLEAIHKTITLFLWLSYRYPCNLLDKQGAHDLKEYCEAQLSKRLMSTKSLERPSTPHRRPPPRRRSER